MGFLSPPMRRTSPSFELPPVIANMYNSSLQEGFIPSLFTKCAAVCPLPKQTPAQSIKDDIRPISFACQTAKIMEGFTLAKVMRIVYYQDSIANSSLQRGSLLNTLSSISPTWPLKHLTTAIAGCGFSSQTLNRDSISLTITFCLKKSRGLTCTPACCVG